MIAEMKWWNPMNRWPLDCMNMEKISLGISCSGNKKMKKWLMKFLLLKEAGGGGKWG